jgi:hypothetical protein
MLMNSFRKIYHQIICLLLIPSAINYAGNHLSIERTSANKLGIQLTNSEEVAGVKFTLSVSPNISLDKVQYGDRTADQQWIIAPYRIDNSTICVLMLNMDRENFIPGTGIIAELPFSQNGFAGLSSAVLSDIEIINKNSETLNVSIDNLEWTNKQDFDASRMESGSFILGQNFPNPFNPSTVITYKLNKPAQVQLSIYDITGKEIRRLIDNFQSDGDYNIEWNSNSDKNGNLASGLYFVRLNVGNESVSRKMVMTK